jgi:hypothetical protein
MAIERAIASFIVLLLATAVYAGLKRAFGPKVAILIGIGWMALMTVVSLTVGMVLAG